MDKYIKHLKFSAFVMLGIVVAALHMGSQHDTLESSLEKARDLSHRAELIERRKDFHWRFAYVCSSPPTRRPKGSYVPSQGLPSIDESTYSASPIASMATLYRSVGWTRGRLSYTEDGSEKTTRYSVHLSVFDRKDLPFTRRNNMPQRWASLSTIQASDLPEEGSIEPGTLDRFPVDDRNPEDSANSLFQRGVQDYTRTLAGSQGMSVDDPRALLSALTSKQINETHRVPLFEIDIPVSVTRALVLLLSYVEAYQLFWSLRKLRTVLGISSRQTYLRKLRRLPADESSETFLLSKDVLDAESGIDRALLVAGQSLYTLFLSSMLLAPVVAFSRLASDMLHDHDRTSVYLGLLIAFCFTLLSIAMGLTHLAALWWRALPFSFDVSGWWSGWRERRRSERAKRAVEAQNAKGSPKPTAITLGASLTTHATEGKEAITMTKTADVPAKADQETLPDPDLGGRRPSIEHGKTSTANQLPNITKD